MRTSFFIRFSYIFCTFPSADYSMVSLPYLDKVEKNIT